MLLILMDIAAQPMRPYGSHMGDLILHDTDHPGSRGRLGVSAMHME
jgi:hypothetical protein